MVPGDLVVSYTIYGSDLLEDAYGSLGIILAGSWSLGRFRVLFSEGGVRWVPVGTVRRVALYHRVNSRRSVLHSIHEGW